jgi:hypothetical protein
MCCVIQGVAADAKDRGKHSAKEMEARRQKAWATFVQRRLDDGRWYKLDAHFSPLCRP